MENTPTQRLVKYFQTKNILQKDVRRIVNVSKQSISNWYNNKVEMRSEYIQKFIQAFPDLSSEWVYSGSGSMIKGEEDYKESNQIVMQTKDQRVDYGQTRQECLEQLDRANKIIDILLIEIEKLKKESE
jgi:hypothetical protein